MAEHIIALEVIADTTQATKGASKLKAAFQDAVNPRPGAAAKATADKASGMGETKTARSVGAGAGTGSAASDFAAQAQGLGGLVHLYATFAANIFAVSAAFNALSKAMDVTNLVKGLDQIGAATGKNLGSLAKQMVNVADGAISMQQAMSSTAMASAGGMTNQAILRMTEVAKKASLALGRDMTDSMDRITKGIIKTQPELLDELGIMTRVIPAQQEYARSIGKTAASLTDFEKRQAFANAVLAEGERKFGAIALDANPYSKILASTNNLIQSGLELVNKVLAPILNLLSSSPTGLAVALGGVVAMLLKQAIPAIGMFRENARKAQEQSHARVLEQHREQQEAAKKSDAVFAEAREKQFRDVDAQQMKLKVPVQFNKKLLGDDVRSLVTKHPLDLSSDEISRIEKKHAELALVTGNKSAEANTKQLAAFLEVRQKMSKAMMEVVETDTENRIAASRKLFDHENQKERILKKYRQKDAQNTVVSNAADNANIYGPGTALSQLRIDTKAMDAGPITKYATLFKGGFSIITTAISTALNAFSVWIQVIGIAIAAFAAFDSWVSKSAKESEAFSSSIETLNSSFANVDRTLEIINKKGSLDFLSVESIQAKATALNDLTGNLTDVIAKFGKLQDAQNGWDKFFDGFWDMFGKGSGDKLALGVSNSVISSLKLMREGPAKEEAKKSIQSLFNTKVDLTSVKAFNESIKDLDKTEIQGKAKAIESLLSTASREANNAASAMTGFKTALADIGRQSTSMSNAILPKDEFSKMGMELAKGSNQMAEALKDPINGLTILRELAGDIKTLSFLPPGLAAQLGGAKAKMDELAVSIANLEKEAQRKELITKGTTGPMELRALNEVEDKRIAKVQARLALETKAAETLKATYASIPDLLNKASVELLTKGLTAALNEASVVAAKGYISVLNAAGIGTANETAAADQQAISGQMDLVKANYANVQSQEGLKVSIEALTLVNERAILEDKLNDAKSISEATSISKLLSENATKFADVVKRGNILSNSRETNLKLFKNKNAEGTSLEDKQAMEQMTTYMYSLIGSEQQLAKLRAQSGAVELTRRVAVISDEVKHAKELLDVEGKKYATEKENIELAIQASGEYSSVLNTRKLEADSGVARVATEKELLTIMGKIQTIQVAIDANKGKPTEKTSTAMEDAKAELLAISKSAEAKDRALKQASLRSDITGLETIRAAEQERTTRRLKETEAISNAQNDAYAEQLTYLSSIGAIEASDLIAEKAKLDIKKQQSAYALESNAIENNASNILAKLAGEYQLAEAVGQSTEAIRARMLEEAASTERQKTALDIINASKLRGIELTAEQAKLIAFQTDRMTQMQSITESLTTAFGDMGTSIGKVVESIGSMIKGMEDMAVRQEALKGKGKDDGSDEYKKYVQDRTKSELTSIATISGATKKLFNEKSLAYKVLDSMEKVSNAVKVGMMMKELIIDKLLVTTKVAGDEVVAASAIASGAAEAGAAQVAMTAKAGSAIAGQGQGDPYSAFGRIAAMMAIMAVVLSAFGGGGGAGSFTMPGGITSADRQETQGTGMSWDANGNKVANGDGVFGDTSAKSESIQKSLDLIAETNVEGMSYQNDMVKLLTSINSGIEKLSMTLYSAQGISTGTGFGTIESTTGNAGGGILSGLFGTSSTDTSIIDSGIVLKGTFLDLADAGKNANAVLNQFETVQTTTTKTGALFGLFGGGSSTSITDNIKGLDSTVREQIGGIFTNAAELFVVQGKKLGAAEGTVMAMLGTINVDKLASLRGLKGADLQKELNAVVGSIMDDTARALFPKLDIFKKFGEGYAQTVTRVIDTNEKIGQAFKQLGRPLAVLPEVASKATEQMYEDVVAAQKKLDSSKSALEASKVTTSTPGATDGAAAIITTTYDPKLMQDVTNSELELANARKTVQEANEGMTVNNLQITEDLANAAGGLDKFLALTSTFSDAFLTPVEKVAPKISAMHDEMDRLGVSTGITKSGLKDLVMNYKVTDAASAQYYVDLMTLANAYEINSAGIAEVADKLGMSSSSIKSILSDAVKNAQSAEEARQLGTQGAADAIGSALQDALISGVAGIVTEAINSIVTNLVSGSTASAVNMVTGGAVAGANVAGGGAVAGANVATGGAVAGANVAEGGSAAAQNLVSGSAVAGGNISNTIQTAVAKVKSFVSTFTEVMKDPEVKSSLKELTAGFGEFAAASFTGSSAISSLTTSIGGSSKAATGAGGGGGAAGAANELASAWQSAADSIFKEVSRIRELMVGAGAAALDSAQAKFDAATALARGGDLEAAKSLPALSQALLTTAESTTSTLLDLRKIQGATQSSLEQTGLGAVAQYGLKLPSYDVGTDRVMGDQIALIHDGEKITPKAYNTGSNDALLNAINVLTQEVSDLRDIMQVAGIYTKKTSDTLTRVTLGGDSMQSTVVASVPVPVA